MSCFFARNFLSTIGVDEVLAKMSLMLRKAKTERKIRRLVETEEPEEAGSWFSRLKKTLNWDG